VISGNVTAPSPCGISRLTTIPALGRLSPRGGGTDRPQPHGEGGLGLYPGLSAAMLQEQIRLVAEETRTRL